jgi:hypothetical protein
MTPTEKKRRNWKRASAAALGAAALELEPEQQLVEQLELEPEQQLVEQLLALSTPGEETTRCSARDQ